MDNRRSWKFDLLSLGLLTGLCLFLGIYLIRGTVLVARDGVFYIRQGQQLPQDVVAVARRYPVGYPAILWAAHEAAGNGAVRRCLYALTSTPQTDSTMLWVSSAQAATLACRMLALIPLFFLGKRLVGARHSFWALLILVLLPYPARYGSDVLREWPYLLFLSLGLLLLYRGLEYWNTGILEGRNDGMMGRGAARRHPRFQCSWVLALAGLVTGAGFLIRPECGQLVLYALLGLVFVARHAAPDARGLSDRVPATRDARAATVGAGLLVMAGFVVPVAPCVYATGTILPHQLQPLVVNAPPAIRAVGSQAASYEPLEFAVAEGELLELPITATDPQGGPLVFSLAGVPVGSRPVYELWSPHWGTYFWTITEREKDSLLARHGRAMWEYGRVVCYAYGQPEARPGLRAVHRFWSPARSRHFYTMDEREKNALLQQSGADAWTFEKVAFYAQADGHHPPDTIPVYRFADQGQGFSWALKDPAYHGPSGGDPCHAAIAWYVHPAGEPPAGAAIAGGVLRWRPAPGQKGDYQLNITVSDGELQDCQPVRIRVTADRGPGQGRSGPWPVNRDPGHESRATSPGAQAARQQCAGWERLWEGLAELAEGLLKNLMAVFLVPWFLGLYRRLRHPADPRERVLLPAVIVANLALVLGRHLGVGAGEDRRYSLGLVALTIFYIPVGIDILAGWIDRIHAFWRPRWMKRILPHAFWFCLLIAVGVTVCVPKLLRSGRSDKTGYLAAAAWLRRNTRPDDVLAVPDWRVSFYAERPELLYARHPDSRRADYVVVIGRDGDVPVRDGWRREYSVAVSPGSRDTVTIYRTARSRVDG